MPRAAKVKGKRDDSLLLSHLLPEKASKSPPVEEDSVVVETFTQDLHGGFLHPDSKNLSRAPCGGVAVLHLLCAAAVQLSTTAVQFLGLAGCKQQQHCRWVVERSQMCHSTPQEGPGRAAMHEHVLSSPAWQLLPCDRLICHHTACSPTQSSFGLQVKWFSG